jgi:hypothetical protein
MTYEDFEKFVREQCMYETIYDDSDGRRILVMRLLDAYGMVNKAVAEEREWKGLTKEEARELCVANVPYVVDMVAALEARLKEKNNG